MIHGKSTSLRMLHLVARMDVLVKNALPLWQTQSADR